jgi:hypothetical protein
LGAGVLPDGDQVEITLDSDLDVEQLIRDYELLDDLGGLGAKSMLAHVSALEQHRQRAELLPDIMQSALTYKGSQRRILVLIQKGQNFFPILYNITKNIIEQKSELDLLEQIACKVSEEPALVAPAMVEQAANLAVKKWCEMEEIPLDKAKKICSIYLLPRSRKNELPHLLGDLLEAQT